ncbi:unnamed protein product [Prorocentrum cordatum]|uniref:Uncharacterized protein n=1 Tax=Prorocentrum cordatum TaxID=2364126 RepID=A0ABN9W1J1_9DINO|nr:unnamed protein product [Polarella glacialis]
MDQGDVFAANVAAKSAKYRYQTGRLFPLVPSIALYVPAGAAAEAPDEGGGPATVLLYRTAFAAEPAGKVFAAQLRRFLLSRSVPLELVEPSEGVWLDWQDVARHRAVLYVPHDLHLMSFSELCALGVPMFTPGDDYLVPFLAHVFTMYGQLCKETAGQLSTEEARAAQALFPYAPHFDDEAHTAFNTAMGHPGDVLLEQVRYWQLYADVSRSALVRRFDSIPQLVEQLLALRRGEAVESLRAAQEALRAEVLDIYRDALPQLLGPPDLPIRRGHRRRAPSPRLAGGTSRWLRERCMPHG